MPLINPPNETEAAQHRRHAAVLHELYKLLEDKTDLNHPDSKYVTPLENHTYLKVLQMAHVINKAILQTEVAPTPM